MVPNYIESIRLVVSMADFQWLGRSAAIVSAIRDLASRDVDRITIGRGKRVVHVVVYLNLVSWKLLRSILLRPWIAISASVSPMAAECLKPWPEQGDATRICG